MNEHEVASQHITVTAGLAGSQDLTIDTHAADGPGSHLSVAYACVLIWLYDLRAVTTYGRVWSETAASIRGATAANTGLNVPPVGGYSPTIGIRATGTDQVDIYPRAEAVIGHVSWAVYDRDAFDHQVAPVEPGRQDRRADPARPVRQSAAAHPQVAISQHR